MGSAESVCDMCSVTEETLIYKGLSNENYPSITKYKSICGGEYYLCPTCIPADKSCSVKKWKELDGKNKYSYEHNCWKDEIFHNYYICTKCYSLDESDHKVTCECGGEIKCFVSNNLEDATNECKTNNLVR